MRSQICPSDKVSRIMKVIDEIALQTNILALSAALESTRVDEAGHERPKVVVRPNRGRPNRGQPNRGQ